VEPSRNRDIWRLHYGYRTGFNFLNYIYQNATVYLPRKYETYKYIKLHYDLDPPLRKRWTKEEDELLDKNQQVSLLGLVALFPKRSKESLRKRLKKLREQQWI
jgi:hypothetical protein